LCGTLGSGSEGDWLVGMVYVVCVVIGVVYGVCGWMYI
jgi:hypothetical protein